MPLIRPDLILGDIDLESRSIARLREHEPSAGYTLGFSGGKDSVVIYELAKRAGVAFRPQYKVTTIDPPELVYFIRREYPDVGFARPEKAFLTLLVERGFPRRQARWCCAEFKERRLEGEEFVVTGIRSAESQTRAKRKVLERCHRSGVRLLHPIIDWTDAEVWQYIRQEGLPYCSLYDEGWKRIGCMLCPFASTAEKRLTLARYPRVEAAFRRAFRRLYARRLEKNPDLVPQWPDGDAMFDWWLEHSPPRKDERQCALWV